MSIKKVDPISGKSLEIPEIPPEILEQMNPEMKEQMEKAAKNAQTMMNDMQEVLSDDGFTGMASAIMEYAENSEKKTDEILRLINILIDLMGALGEQHQVIVTKMDNIYSIFRSDKS